MAGVGDEAPLAGERLLPAGEGCLPTNFLELWESDSSFNTQKYENSRYDQLIEGARTEPDPAKRMGMLLEAERILVEEDAATAPMYFEGETHLLRPSIKNFVDHPYGAGIDVRWWRIEA